MNNIEVENDQIFHKKKDLIQLGDIKEILKKLEQSKISSIYFSKNICSFESLQDIKELTNLRTDILNKEITFSNIKQDYFKFDLSYNAVSQFLEFKIPNYIDNNLEKDLYIAIYPNVIFEVDDNKILAIYMISLNFIKSTDKKEEESGIIKLKC